MPEIACINGRMMPLTEATVSIDDRGYYFADAVYEYIAGYHGRLFAIEAHLNRLERSLTALAFPHIDLNAIHQTISDAYRASAIDKAGIYLQISRGVAPRNHAFPPAAQPQVVVIVRPIQEPPRQYRHNGIKAITVSDLRWGRCDIKTVMLLPNVLAKQQALDKGAQDAIFLGPEGVVREATSANLFIVRDNQVRTHPLTPNILPGVTRDILLRVCRNHGIDVLETFFDRADMIAAEEVFLTSTVAEVLPVTWIDSEGIGKGMPGPMTVKLRDLLERQRG